MRFGKQILDLWEAGRHRLSDVLPSEWAEQRMKVVDGPFPGPLSYDRTPMHREIADCFSPYSHYNFIALMGGSQIGKTRMVIEPLIAWLIANHPCNIGYLTGHSELSEESMQKMENALENARLDDGRMLREILRNASVKKRNQRTGDTSKKKEFPGGSLISGSATNHKLLRQYNWKVIIADDLEAAKKASKESGSTVAMINHRAASYGSGKKIFYCSTPELKLTSQIEPLFLKGDQRRYYVPCPCCHKFITLEWSPSLRILNEKVTYRREAWGMDWKMDPETGKLDVNSVGYICQECGGFFTDRNKRELLMNGLWKPTAEPYDATWVSFHLSALYSMAGSNSWATYVQQYLDARPPGKPINEYDYKTFVNLVLGLTYEPVNESPSGSQIERNRRGYMPWEVPNLLSVADGNGEIVLLTCAVDMNGKVDDARLDWQVVGHAENGATYNIAHGSIGTFIPRENTLKEKVDRVRWTYEMYKPNSVWGELEKVLGHVFNVENSTIRQFDNVKNVVSTRKMKIAITTLDTGYFTNYAYQYLDVTNNYVVGVKGDKEDKYLKYGIDVRWFKKALERAGLYILQVGLYKDHISDNMKLGWDKGDSCQPSGFMNFPEQHGGMYEWDNFFAHFESEHRTPQMDSKGNMLFRWVKKQPNSQNHCWDTFLYNMAARDIFVRVLGDELKLKEFQWGDAVRHIKG